MPLRYFEMHGPLPDWPRFLDEVQRHWLTDDDHVHVGFVRDGSEAANALTVQPVFSHATA
ncbi:MAG: hypothetical protein NTZ14_01195 [Hyphomicrobiales bacterium]|nr:hypothetical protein [Hyphomicrobiales bacterium]